MICVDASFVVRLVTFAPEQSPYRRLWDEWISNGQSIVAPTLIMYEVTNALYRSAIAGLFPPEIAREFVAIALELPIQLFGESELHERAWEIAQKFSLPATYDSHYLALAEKMNTDLWTADKRLVNAVGNQLNWISLAE